MIYGLHTRNWEAGERERKRVSNKCAGGRATVCVQRLPFLLTNRLIDLLVVIDARAQILHGGLDVEVGKVL